MAERGVELTITNEAEAAGWLVRKVAWVGRAGCPDRLFMRGGRTIWIEFKDYGAVPRVQQVREHCRMREIGGQEVHVVDRANQARRLLRLPLK